MVPSWVATWMAAAPVALAVAVKVTEASAALTAVALPLICTVPVPSPVITAAPPVVTLSVPPVAMSVVARLSPSASLTRIWLPWPALSTIEPFSASVCVAAGTVCTGASLAPVTVIVTVAGSLLAPWASVAR